MNLVQIIERLKDLPEQAIRQYANGMNPEIPAYVALGELQRRERVAQQMATAQGAQQGPQPSIKEQIEQRAGLMAAQGLQQQQMMQQMAQQRVPGPVPAGVPQPEDQPEAQPTMTAARGGLARAPVDFNFQSGGIVAFSNGGGARVHPQAELIEFLKKMGLTPEEFTKAPPKVQNEIRDMMRAGTQAAAPTSAAPTAQAAKSSLFRSVNPAGVAGYGLGLYHGNLGEGEEAELERRRKMAPTIDNPEYRASENRRALNQADAALRSTPAAPSAPVADLKALADQQRRQQPPSPAPTPTVVAPAATAAPAQPDPNSMDAMFRTQLGKAPKERTVEEIQAEQRAIREGAGLTEPAGLAQLERIRKLQEQYEGSKPTPLQDLIRVLGQSAQYKGMSGMAPAYTANIDQKRAADLAMAKQINEMMSGVETTQRGEMKDIATGTTTARGADRAAGVDFTKNLMTTLGTARGQDITASTAEANRKTQERGQDIQKEMTIINARANAAGRPFNIIEQLFNRLKTGDPTKDAAILQKIVAENAEAKKPGLDIELIKKFESLPGVKTDLQMLSALRTQANPKPETVERIRKLEGQLATKARQNGIDPSKIGVTGSSASPGVNSDLFDKADAILSGGQ